MSQFTVKNDSTGSLKVGAVRDFAIGEKILLAGETNPRTVTYVMGKGDKQTLTFKGQGPLPLGEIDFSLVG